ncbi:hypothetical protein T440DRAFT_247696 [Plenodomus tracheiphilus IPT5]|uniref:Uncharacterized protein n=1 Tax=Plenodomus tracheiphilus IPT5 TaxID=1408161 RepID=A0A6A7ASM2_9PLEO|nr:hypothetical protein T440DRAFT_247696 [Plenodomus tracheiphilus IPT5]
MCTNYPLCNVALQRTPTNIKLEHKVKKGEMSIKPTKGTLVLDHQHLSHQINTSTYQRKPNNTQQDSTIMKLALVLTTLVAVAIAAPAADGPPESHPDLIISDATPAQTEPIFEVEKSNCIKNGGERLCQAPKLLLQ